MAQNDLFFIEYRRKMGSPLHIEKYFESFEDAVKRKDQL